MSLRGVNFKRALVIAICACGSFVAVEWFVEGLARVLELLHFVNQIGAIALNTVSRLGYAVISSGAVLAYFFHNRASVLDAAALIATCGVALVTARWVENAFRNANDLPTWTFHDIVLVIAVMSGTAGVRLFIDRWR